jgi:dienelactone hydrolase
MANAELALAYDGGDVITWQRKLRPKLRELLGDWHTDRVDLNVRKLWCREHELGVIEKIVFTSEPGADIPAYVCIPNNVQPPYPFMICLQGHSTGMHNSIAVDREDETRSIQVDGDRDFALESMRRGVPAFCIEQRSFGERRELRQEKIYQKGYCHDAFLHALSLGRTLIGERVFDVERGIDYLYSRPDVDRRRIGVMGNSGGGTTSIFAAAVLDRLCFAMPSCSFGTWAGSRMVLPLCECGYVPGLLKWAEMADVMGLFAPRPVVIVAAEKDNVAPIESAREAFYNLKTIYRAAGAEDRCHLVVGHEGHRFYADMAWPMIMAEMEQI